MIHGPWELLIHDTLSSKQSAEARYDLVPKESIHPSIHRTLCRLSRVYSCSGQDVNIRTETKILFRFSKSSCVERLSLDSMVAGLGGNHGRRLRVLLTPRYIYSDTSYGVVDWLTDELLYEYV